MRVGYEVALALLAVSTPFAACGGNAAQPADSGLAGASGNGVPSGGAGGVAASGTAGTATTGGGIAGTLGAGGSSGKGGAGGTNGMGGKAGAGGASGSVGIGGSSSIAGAAGSGAALAQFMPIRTAFCAAARTCCAKEGVEMTLSDCESAHASRQVALASIDQGAVTVDSAAFARCRHDLQCIAGMCEDPSLTSGGTCDGYPPAP